MSLVFQTKIDQIGLFASKFFEEGLLILFSSNEVMSEIKNYCVLTSESKVLQTIKKDQILSIGENDYKIVDVGYLVEENLKLRGHVTINNSKKPTNSILPGTIYIENKKDTQIKIKT